MSEINVETVTVHGKNCVGCRRHKKDVMVSVTNEADGHGDIHDLLFSKEVAEKLCRAIEALLKGSNNGVVHTNPGREVCTIAL